MAALVLFMAGCMNEGAEKDPPNIEKKYSSYACPGQFEGYPACATSFTRILVEPEIYEGKVVAITGFLGVSDGFLVLYPDQNSYALRIEEDALIVVAPRELKEKFFSDNPYHYVRVFGVFQKGAGKQRYHGTLAEPLKIIRAIGRLDKEGVEDITYE